MAASPIAMAAQKGADDSVRLLAYLGARLIMRDPDSTATMPFWHKFGGSNGRVRDPALWQRIVAEGGNEETPESLRKGIRLLKKAGIEDFCKFVGS